MLTVLIGVILIAVLGYLIHIQYEPENGLGILMIILLTLFGLGLPLLGTMLPLQGYEETVLTEEIELVSFNLNNEEKTTYVIQSDKTRYSYIYEQNDEYEIHYETGKLSGNSVKVIESKSCDKAVLRVYEKKAKKGIWTLAICNNLKEYVLYIPENTIARSKIK